MAKGISWIGLGVLGASLLTACPQNQSQAFRPVPEPTAVPSGTPYLTEPVLPTDLSVVPKLDEAELPGGKAPAIPLFEGFADSGSGSGKPVSFYVFAVDDLSRSIATQPTTRLNQVTAIWTFVRPDGQPVAGQQAVLATVPGELGYSPYYQIHRVTVPADYQANQVRDHRTVLRALGTVDSGFQETVLPVAVNLPVVAEKATLTGNTGVKPAQAWYMGRRAYHFTFDTQPVNASDGTVEASPLYAVAPTLLKVPAGYDKAKELPRLLPFLNQQGNGTVLADAVLDVLPEPVQSTPEAPEKTAYGGIKAVIPMPQTDNYRFRSATNKRELPNLGEAGPTKVWLNAPIKDSLRP